MLKTRARCFSVFLFLGALALVLIVDAPFFENRVPVLQKYSVTKSVGAVGSAVYDILHDKEIILEGEHVPPSAINRLPLEKSVWYWLTSRSQLTSILESDPKVQAASIARCATFSLNCFEVRITARAPKAIVIGRRGTPWLVGSDGGFIERFKGAEENTSMTLLGGIFIDNPTPDLAKKRVQGLLASLDEIRSVSPTEVKRLELCPGGEIDLFFKGVPLSVRLSGFNNSWPVLRREVERATTVLATYRGREEMVRSIDVSYAKFAVVNEVPQEVSRIRS